MTGMTNTTVTFMTVVLVVRVATAAHVKGIHPSRDRTYPDLRRRDLRLSFTPFQGVPAIAGRNSDPCADNPQTVRTSPTILQLARKERCKGLALSPWCLDHCAS